MDCSLKVFEDGWTGRREAALSERETCAAEGEGRRQGHLRKTNVLQKKQNNSNKETILSAIPETYESVRCRVRERDLLMYRQVKD